MTLQIQQLTKCFGENVAVNHLNLTLPKGEVLGPLGRNGAGKTTTIKMLLSLLTPNEGSIMWDKKEISKGGVTIGYLPEERGLYTKSRVIDQLRYFGRLEGMTKKEVDNASLFGLPIDFAKLDAKVISLFIVFFITGYLLYAMMYAAAGAVVSKTEDLQSVSFPVAILIIAAFFISFKSLSDPNSAIVVISSYIPFFTPMVTFSRVVAGEAGALEISITLSLLLATIFLLNFITSRIYVNGVMSYSDKVKFKDLTKFIKRH